MNCNITLRIIKLISFLIFLAPVLTTQINAQSLQQELQRGGFSLQEVQRLARNAGVNPNNPAELASFARQIGVSESQIQEYLSQIAQADGGTNTEDVVDVTEVAVTSDQLEETLFNEKQILNPQKINSSDGLPFFGYGIFSNTPDRFLPSVLGPVDEGYIIGPDDELRLIIWGATELQYELAVDVEGRTYIPTIGLITVAGQSLTELRKSLKKTLSKSYSGLIKTPATVFMDVTVTRFKPIEVFVLGEVNNPGGYTFQSKSSLFNILYGIGGPKTSGSLRDIQIIRKGKVIASVDLYEMLLRGIDPSNVPLLNNDRIFIPPRKSTISIKGPVFREAIYELKEGETINNLIEYAGGLRPEAYGERFQINRIVPLDERIDPNYARERIDYNLRKVLEGDEHIALEDGDKLTLFNISSISDNYVKILGGVNQPGTYQLDAEITHIKDLILLADSLQDDALNSTATLVRTRDDSTKFSFNFDVFKALENNPDHNLSLQKRDVLEIFETDVLLLEDQSIQINGEVSNPGSYSFSKGMTLQDVLLKAGGFKESSYINSAEITRTVYIESNIQRAISMVHPLLDNDNVDDNIFYTENKFEQLMESASKVELQANDNIFIRKNPKFRVQDRISLEGEVFYSGEYTILYENEKLSSVIRRAGGLTPEAYARGARLIRDSSDVVIELDKILKNDKSSDIIIFAGDRLVVPKQPNTVLVTGNVALEGLFKYKPNAKFTYYLDQAGGIQPQTEKYFLLTQANGSTFRVKRKGIFKDNPKVEDGAVITAIFEPLETQKEKLTFREILDESLAVVTSIFTLYYILSLTRN